MSKSILVINSWGGDRRYNRESPQEMLEYQYQSLKNLRHNLNEIVVVTTGNPKNSLSYKYALLKFNNVIYRDNKQGSYGSWLYAWKTYGNQYDWYYLLEDDYVFMLDNFDTKLKDMWESNMGYLCSSIGENSRNINPIITTSNGLVSANGFAEANFDEFHKIQDIYDPNCQIKWGEAFLRSSLKVKTIIPTYDTPFFTGLSIWNFSKTPAIIGPIQMYKNYPYSKAPLGSHITVREVD